MRIRVAIAGTFAGLVVAGCGTASQVASQGGSGTPASVAPPAASQPAVSGPTTVNGAKARPVVFDCSNQGVVRPGTYVLACADDGSLLIHMSWTRWTSEQAVATGIHQLHDCTPNCAESAKWDNYPAVITFWRPEPVPDNPGETYFSRLTVRYTTSVRPPTYRNYDQLVAHPVQWSEVLRW